MASEYDVTQATYRTAAPVHVDSNGVPIAVPVPEPLSNPAITIVEIAEGTTTQLVEPSSAVRTVVLVNVGNVPVYITTTPTVTIRRATTVALSNFGLPLGTPLHCGGEPLVLTTASGLYGTLRKTSGIAGLPAFFNQSGLVSVTL